MKTNALPKIDMTDCPTGCCPRFKPECWDGQHLHFDHKKFLHATTLSALHVPLNMGKVFTRVQAAIEAAKAAPEDTFLVLSKDNSAWSAEHYFAVNRDVKGEHMVSLTGDYLTKVFECPYAEAKHWLDDMKSVATASGHEAGEVYFFYTTCPKCAKVYGKNYVVGVVQLGAKLAA